MFTEDHASEIIVSETVSVNNIAGNIIEIISEKPFYPVDPIEFVSKLTGGGMEVVSVFPPNPNIGNWIGILGTEGSGRRYFDYTSPLYPKPISSPNEMFAMFNIQAEIARHFNPGAYIISLDINICNAESEEIERHTLSFNVKPGVIIQDYRREGILKFTLRDTADGSLHYGMYMVVSAIVTQNEEEAGAYSTLQEWMERSEKSDISDLFVRLLKGVVYED
jgi:hypothetical protein